MRQAYPRSAPESTSPRNAVTFAQGDTTCETYASCAGGAEVTLCTVTAGGHTWPGGLPVPGLGHTTTEIVATEAMWAFFEEHPLDAATGL